MQTPKDIRVESWSELLDELYADSWQENIRRHRSKYVFRGLSCSCYDLKTSLIRLGGDFSSLEFHLIRNFKKYSRLPAAADFSVWMWLTLAQHHGLPTRLLDWTYSPFIALHFVTSEISHFEQDGAIWCVDFAAIHRTLPQEIKAVLDDEKANAFTIEMLSKVTETLTDFEKLSAEAFVLFFEPPSMDDRIVNQFALHSVISNPRSLLNELLRDRFPDYYKRVIVPKELKWEIRDKLDQANINERVIFPGLEGLCSWLTRHYSPR
ncbi:FRG domain-containing protein [bacterium]|nr:FRG domain-containing protein [bacterium]